MTAGVSVRVETVDGWPVANAILTLTDLAGRQAGIATVDDDGETTLSGLVPGMYTAIFTAPGYHPSATATVVQDGRVTPLGTIRLERLASEHALPAPGPWTIDPAHSAIHVTARHAGIASVRGRLSKLGGRITVGSPIERSSVTATIDASSVDTGNSMRDNHLRSADFLNVERYPTITYQSTGLSPAGPDRWTVHGDLTMCGERHRVDLDMRYLGTDKDPFGFVRCGFRASGQLRREEFRISFAQTLATGVALVGSTLRMEIDIEAVQGETAPDFG